MNVRKQDLPEFEGAEVGERELAVAFKEGDPEAYSAIHARYRQKVERICRRMLGNPDDAQEAAQEAFLRVYQGLPRFNGRYQLGAWVARIATNVCLDQLRSRSRKPLDPRPLEAVEADTAVTASDPEVISLQRSEADDVRGVLADLPPLHRAAIVLRDYEGLSYAEVAHALEISEVQVKALIHRARKGFKRSWSSIAHLLIPARLVQRMKSWDTPFREQLPQIVSPISQAASSCSVAVQQCGQYVGDKVAAVVMVAVVGTGVAAAGAGAAHPEPAARLTLSTPSSEAEELVETFLPEEGSDGPSRQRSAAAVAGGERPEGPLEDTPPEEVAPPAPHPTPTPATTPEAPAASPTPTPTSTQPAQTAPAPQQSATPDRPAPEATPSPTPTEAPEPAPFAPAVGFTKSSPPRAVVPYRETSTAACDTGAVIQRLHSSMSFGEESLPMYLYLETGPESYFELAVTRNRQTIHYYGTGGSFSGARAEDGAVSVRVEGSYEERGSTAPSAGLPSSGTFKLELLIDCEKATLRQESLALSS